MLIHGGPLVPVGLRFVYTTGIPDTNTFIFDGNLCVDLQ
jgi:hypothetical protein